MHIKKLFLFCSLSVFAVSQKAQCSTASIDKAVDMIKPALVRIHVVSAEYEGGKERKGEGVGSGAIIDKSGYVITNHHVAGKAIRLICTLSDQREIEADLVGTDALADISIIKLKNDGKTVFPYAEFGDSSKLKVGETVLAMGSPYAFSQSVTMGIVSNTGLVFPEVFWPFQFTLDGENVGSIVKWIGHDAAIFPGNSGGPLVTLDGKIAGINEISLGLGGAIPANLAKEVAREIIRNGKVTRSWLGIEFQPLLKYSFENKGVLISGAIKDSPAEKAGFHSGDILLKIDEKPVTVKFPEEIPDFNILITNLPVGRKTEAVVLRDGKEKTLELISIERQPAQPRIHELKEWGMDASNINFLKSLELERNSSDGVLVSSTRPGGPCDEAKPALSGGDVIVKVMNKDVKNVEQLISLTKEILAGKDSQVPLMVQFERKKNSFLTVVNAGPKQFEDTGKEVKKAWMGADTQVLTKDIREKLDLSGTTGVRITRIYSNSPAEKAGLKTGDFIVSIDGTEIPVESQDDSEVFPSMIRQYKIGSTAELEVVRGKDRIKMKIAFAGSPEMPQEEKKFRDENFDFEVRNLTPWNRRKKNKPGELSLLTSTRADGRPLLILRWKML